MPVSRPRRPDLQTIHLCVDMQNVFLPDGPWAAPWMPRVMPVVEELAGRFSEWTFFTRFLTPSDPAELPGAWQPYYQVRPELLKGRLDAHWLDLPRSLARFVPPAKLVDKFGYSAFSNRHLHAELRARGIVHLIVTGSETDMCIAATVLAAVDLGYRVSVVSDGICSSSDAGHDAQMALYKSRFTDLVDVVTAEAVLSQWRVA